MILYPAIDILEGKAVRLVQGRFEDKTVYQDDPLEAARSWVEAGARFLHVVDLDGARSAPARRASRTAVSDRRPPPYYTGMPVPCTIRRRCSIDFGSPERAPSRSTTCRKRAPASTQLCAAASGSSW